MSRIRLKPADRKSQILDAALRLAASEGLNQFGRDQVAALAECSVGLINLHFSTMCKLRRAVMGAAIATENLNVIAQGLIMRDPRACKAPEPLRRKAAASLMGE